MTRPRICLATFSYPPEPGGVGRSAHRLVKYLLSAGYDLEVFTPRRDVLFGIKVALAGTDKVPVHRVAHDGTPGGIVGAISEAAARVDKMRAFDLFHGFFLPMAMALLPVARVGGPRPLLASIRGDDAVGWLADGRERWILPALRHATWVTSVNHDLLARAVEASRRHLPCSVISNGVDQPAFRWHLDHSFPGRVGTVGIFQPKKEIPLLVEAYADIPSHLRTRLLLVGHAVDRWEDQRITTAIRRAGLEEEVEVTGWSDDLAIAHHLASLRVFVQCSRHEGFPNALLEAAATGVPLVSTAVGAMTETFAAGGARPGQEALLVPAGDAPALARAVTRILADESLARSLSEGAISWASRHTTAAEAQAWLTLYRRLAGSGSA